MAVWEIPELNGRFNWTISTNGRFSIVKFDYQTVFGWIFLYQHSIWMDMKPWFWRLTWNFPLHFYWGVYNRILKFCTGGCHCFVHIPGGRIPRIAGENQQETFHIWCPVVLFFQAVMNARNLCSAVLKHGWEIHDKYGATVKSSLSKWWKKNKCI